MVVINFATMFLCRALNERDKHRTLTTNIAILHKLWYTYCQGI